MWYAEVGSMPAFRDKGNRYTGQTLHVKLPSARSDSARKTSSHEIRAPQSGDIELKSAWFGLGKAGHPALPYW